MADFGDVDPTTGLPSARTQFEGQLDPNAPSVANGRITPEAYAQYQRDRQRKAILGILSVLGATTGLGFAGQAGAGAAGAGGAASSPEFGVGAANTGTWSGAGMTPSAFSGAAGAGGAAAGGGFLGMSAKDLAALGLGLGGVVGGAMSKPPDMSPNTGTNDPQLRELLNMMMGRMRKAEPLQDSVLSMANGLLPTQYQKGGGGMG